jgi:hypothetical protein
MVISFPAYAGYEYSFPHRDRNPKEKDAKYHRNNAEAVYSLFLRNKTSFGLLTINDFLTNRLYSNGDQPIDQYKSFLMHEETEDGSTVSIGSFDDTHIGKLSKRSGWGNVLFKNVSPAPLYLNAIHGMLDKYDWDVYADTIDSNSNDLKENLAYTKLCEGIHANWQVEYKKNAGIPVDENTVLPKSVEELKMFEAKDGFKLNVARAMQKLTRHAFNISDWDGDIRKKVVDDLVCLGYGAVRDYFDSEDSKWKVSYVDPARLVIQFSNEYDYDDAEYCGYFHYWTISNLRNKLPDVPENDWYALAHAAYTLYGNPRDRWESFYSQLDPTTATYRYDGFKVPIFECQWMDTDIEKKLYYKSVRGRNSIINLDYDSEVKPLDQEKINAGANQEIKRIYKRHVRQCFWVLNTDYVFDWGPVQMASREGLSKPHLTFHVEQLLQPSLIKRMIPILDQISMLFLRWQNSLAMMRERGYAVNVSMLANVTFGGKILKPKEVLEIWQKTGRLLYSYTNTPTGLYSGGAAIPVTEMEGGLGKRVEETMKALEMQFWELEKITGINMATLGMTPLPQTGKDTQKDTPIQTPNVLQIVINAVMEIKRSVAISLLRRTQIGLRNDEKIREAYAGVVGKQDIDALVMMEGDGVQYGIELRPRPDQAQRATFRQWIQVALQNTREQRPGIDLNDAIYFESKLNNGADLNELEKELEYAIEKNKQEAQQNSMMMIQQQAQANAQAEQSKAQGQMAIDQNVSQGKIQEESVRGNVKDSLLTKEYNMEILKQLMAGADAEDGLLNAKPSSK